MIQSHFSGSNEIPIETNEFWEVERNLKQEAGKLIDQPVLENAPKELVQNLESNFEQSLNDEVDWLWQWNCDVSWEDSQSLFDRMYSKIN